MSSPIRILLQTTIPTTEDDWHIGRFSLLKSCLANLTDAQGQPLCHITARNREAIGSPDPVLSKIDNSDFDELWLFAVDTGDGLTAEDCEAIGRFRRSGRGLLVTRDHMDLGSSVCTLGGVGAAHYFHSRSQEPDPARHARDDVETADISWPNYHSGANGDFQLITIAEPRHDLLRNPNAEDGWIRYFPSHPHEGAIGAPNDDHSARVIATGVSKASGRTFNLAVAFEASSRGGPAIAESTFHHFADYNWDPSRGSPTFVTEKPGGALAATPPAKDDIQRYVRNLAIWLAGRSLEADQAICAERAAGCAGEVRP